MKFRKILPPVVAASVALALAACSGGSGGGASPSSAAKAHGPIKIWYSNNAQEVAWGKSMVKAWNAHHPKEKVTGQQIPAGKSSEEVITAAIAAGNAPCLIYNTSPASVPGNVKQGGMVPLNDFPGATNYIRSRTGERASQYKSPDGKFYQMPWKSNPVMVFYNKKVFAKAGIDTKNPPLKTYSQFIATSKQLVKKGGVRAAIWPAASSEFFQSWFDYYPLFIAASGGKQLVASQKAQFTSPEGLKVAQFWRTMYQDNLVPKENYTGDSFGDQKAAMAIVGPWAIAVYGGKVDWGVVPVPTPDGMPASQIHTFSDEKSIGMYSACQNRATAWDFLKFTTSKKADGTLLDMTGQMPMRTDLPGTFPAYFSKHPEYKDFASQAERTVEVPYVPNSVKVWQTFRDAYSKSVIFGSAPVDSTLKQAATQIDSLTTQK